MDAIEARYTELMVRPDTPTPPARSSHTPRAPNLRPKRHALRQRAPRTTSATRRGPHGQHRRPLRRHHGRTTTPSPGGDSMSALNMAEAEAGFSVMKRRTRAVPTSTWRFSISSCSSAHCSISSRVKLTGFVLACPTLEFLLEVSITSVGEAEPMIFLHGLHPCQPLSQPTRLRPFRSRESSSCSRCRGQSDQRVSAIIPRPLQNWREIRDCAD